MATLQRKIKAVLVDLSGTIHVGDRAIPGAADAILKLRRNGIAVKFVTNTSKMSSKSLRDQLRSIGFCEDTIPQGSITTSAVAARELLLRRQMRPLCLVEDDLKDDLSGLEFANPNCVLVGLAPSAFSYGPLNDAFRLLLRLKENDAEGGSGGGSRSGSHQHSPLIAIHRAKYYRDGDELSLGPGGFVTCLEEAAGVKADVVGKPSSSFFEAALNELGVEAQEAAMIGDDVAQDVGGALAAGVGTAILVRTGKYMAGDEAKSSPTVVVDSIVQAVEYICSNC